MKSILFTACLILLMNFAGCFPAPPVEDNLISTAKSPSGKYQASVIERDAGILTPTSIIVFLHATDKAPSRGVALIAITEGSAPLANFVDERKLRIRLYGGKKHNQRFEALGVNVEFE